MSNPRPAAGPRLGEFVALMALMTSLVAMSIDLMLPALADIGADLGVQQDNANQLVLTMIFLGLALGQLFYGALSDSIGRKRAIYLGYAVFFAGSLLTIFAVSFPMMLAGRLMQGLGVAGPRGVSMALIRDRFEGRAMAQVMSFITVVFILVPVIAPSLGQAILLVADWRAIFVVLFILGVVSLLWFALRQPETLPAARRAPLSAARVARALREVLGNPIALGYTLMAGLIAAALQGYLSSAQQIFQFQYGLGTLFPLIFAINAAGYRAGIVCQRAAGDALWHAHPAADGAAHAVRAVGGLRGRRSGHGRAAAALAVHGLSDAQLLLHWHPVRQHERPGHGAAGPHRRAWARRWSARCRPCWPRRWAQAIGQAYNGTVTPLVLGFAVLRAGRAGPDALGGRRADVVAPRLTAGGVMDATPATPTIADWAKRA